VTVTSRGQHSDGDDGDQRDRRCLGGEDNQRAEPDGRVGETERQCRAGQAQARLGELMFPADETADAFFQSLEPSGLPS
jgi:hypothetical protein